MACTWSVVLSGYSASSTTKAGRHDIAETLLKVALNTIKSNEISQRGYQNLYIGEEQTTQWPKGKVHKNKQRSTKHAHKIKDRVTRTLLKLGVNCRCSGRDNSSCSISGSRRVNLVTNPVISHKWGRARKVFITSNNLHQVRSEPQYLKENRQEKIIESSQ